MTTPTLRNTACWLTGLSLGCLAGAAIPAGPVSGPKAFASRFAQDSPTPAKEQGPRRLDVKQLAGLEEKLQKLQARLAPSVVRLLHPDWVDERYPDSRGTLGASGVIISPEGEILTCGHHPFAPRTRLLVQLADGRKVKATVLGRVNYSTNAAKSRASADFGLARLDEKGPWPAATFGRPADLEKDDLCLALGYPHVHKAGQPPLLRLGRVLSPHPKGEIRSTSRILWGDSGGPLFDLEGRLLGVTADNLTPGTVGAIHASIDGLPKLRDRLRAGKEIDLEKELPDRPEWRKEQWGAWEPTDELSKTLSAVRQSTVEILSAGKVIALGLVVDRDGLILTKRSELSGPRGPRPLVCRLANGDRLEPRVLAESREHDLALLQVPAKGLPAVPWDKSARPGVGQLIASLGPGPRPLHYGVVGALRVKNPATRGYLLISGKTAPGGAPGMVFAKLLPSSLAIDEELRDVLQAGDLITHLNDVPTPSAEQFAVVRDRCTRAAHLLAGEWLKLTLQRKGKTVQVFLPLLDSPVQVFQRAEVPVTGFPGNERTGKRQLWNLRMNGFPDVFSHDGAVDPDRCGGPVVDRSGRVIGVNIARADPIQTYAIPGDVVRDVVAELKALALKEGSPPP